MWTLLATEPTLAGLVDALWNQYDVRADILAHDVAVTLTAWLDAGLIVWR